MTKVTELKQRGRECSHPACKRPGLPEHVAAAISSAVEYRAEIRRMMAAGTLEDGGEM